MSVRRLALPLAAIFAGCGPSSFSDFRDQLVERSCARLIRCGQLAADEPAYCPVPAELAPIVAELGGDLDIDAAVARGWLSFDSDGAQRCLDAVGNAACDPAEAARLDALDCHHVIAPGVSVGAACPENPTCVGGVCAAHQCGGVCVAYPAPGASCVSDGGIGDGGRPLDCDPSVEFCAAGVCVYHAQPGGKCAADSDCTFAYTCNAGKCGDAPTVATGGACDGTHPCRTGAACFDGTCQLLLQSGAQCDGADGAAPCADGLVCRLRVLDAGSAAVCAAPSGAGGNCVAVSDESGCAADQFCQLSDGGVGSCQSTIAGRPVGPGQLCDANHPCLTGLYCSTQSNTCTFPSGRGGACTAAGDCLPGLTCVAGINRCDRPGCSGSIAADAGVP